jgi:hypothetical protein
MRQAFHAELDELISDLVKLARRVGRMMTGASTALWHADFRLAESIICGQSKVTTALCDDIERRCVRLLVLQAPVATDLRVVVAVLGAVSDVVRMGKLGGHIATGIPSCRRRRDRYPRPSVTLWVPNRDPVIDKLVLRCPYNPIAIDHHVASTISGRRRSAPRRAAEHAGPGPDALSPAGPRWASPLDKLPYSRKFLP